MRGKNKHRGECPHCKRYVQKAYYEWHVEACLLNPANYEPTREFLAELQARKASPVTEKEYVTAYAVLIESDPDARKRITSTDRIRKILGRWSRAFDFYNVTPHTARPARPILRMGPLPDDMRAANRNDIPERDFGAIATLPPKTKRIYDWSAHGYITVTLYEVR